MRVLPAIEKFAETRRVGTGFLGSDQVPAVFLCSGLLNTGDLLDRDYLFCHQLPNSHNI